MILLTIDGIGCLMMTTIAAMMTLHDHDDDDGDDEGRRRLMTRMVLIMMRATDSDCKRSNHGGDAGDSRYIQAGKRC